MKTSLVPLVAAALVLSVSGSALAAGTYRDDDGTRETAVLVDNNYDRATKRLYLPPSHLAGATGATLWVYAQAEACAESGFGGHIRVNEGYVVVANYDPCAIWSESSFGWHGFPISMTRLRDGQVNEFRIYSGNGTATGHNASYGVDTTSDNGRSDIHQDDPSFTGDIDGELMVYLELTGSPPVASPSTVVFGLTDLGAATARTVSVTRYGTQNLDVTSLAIAGTHPGDFAVSADTCTGSSSPPGTACTFQVTFTPLAKGSRYATVTLATNAGDSAIPLHGEGRGDPPVTTFTTPDGAVLTRLDSVTGTVADDTGLARLDVTFTPVSPSLATVGVLADLSCDPARTVCAWSSDVLFLAPGPYTVTARATDTQGMVEPAPPNITVIVV